MLHREILCLDANYGRRLVELAVSVGFSANDDLRSVLNARLSLIQKAQRRISGKSLRPEFIRFYHDARSVRSRFLIGKCRRPMCAPASSICG